MTDEVMIVPAAPPEVPHQESAPVVATSEPDAPPPERKLHVEQFLEDKEVAEQLAALPPLTIAGFIRAHQAPRTRDEWVKALALFTTGRL